MQLNSTISTQKTHLKTSELKKRECGTMYELSRFHIVLEEAYIFLL